MGTGRLENSKGMGEDADQREVEELVSSAQNRKRSQCVYNPGTKWPQNSGKAWSLVFLAVK